MFTRASPLLLDAVLLNSSWINAALLAVEFSCIAKYFREPRVDKSVYRVLVCASSLFDTVDSVGVFAYVYEHVISSPRTIFPPKHWSIRVMMLASSSSAISEHLFLIYRFWALSRNLYVTSFAILLVLAHAALIVAGFIFVTMLPSSPTGLNMATTFSAAAKCLTASADIFIAIAMVLHLRRVKSPFRNTQSMIRQLSAIAITSGAIAAVTMLVTTILFLMDNVFFNIFFLSSGRIYTLTILANLRMRKEISKRSTIANTFNGQTAGISSIHFHRSLGINADDVPIPLVHVVNEMTGESSLTANDKPKCPPGIGAEPS
ncbi:hypothetical protein HGRIS_011805 [Hohenbuehelia grisea]|uniref:DUF6534 domain-containing protein n=1 Tax=Hohenbuehelia grisea TaxID=104357 RepID=A0ABR3JXB6_9AGAR